MDQRKNYGAPTTDIKNYYEKHLLGGLELDLSQRGLLASGGRLYTRGGEAIASGPMGSIYYILFFCLGLPSQPAHPMPAHHHDHSHGRHGEQPRHPQHMPEPAQAEERQLPPDQEPVYRRSRGRSCRSSGTFGGHHQGGVGLWRRHVHGELHRQRGLVVAAHRHVRHAQDRQGLGVLPPLRQVPPATCWGRPRGGPGGLGHCIFRRCARDRHVQLILWTGCGVVHSRVTNR